MQTPLEMFMRFLEENNKVDSVTIGVMKRHLKPFKKIERRVIIDARVSAPSGLLSLNAYEKEAEQYFNQTFKT